MTMLIKREKCELCGRNENLEVLFSLPYSHSPLLDTILAHYGGNTVREDFDRGAYELVYCQSCQFFFQRYAPNDILAQKIYTYPPQRIKESFIKRTQSSIDYYSENALLVQKMSALFVGTLPYKNSVLDFGMGWGFFLLMAKAHGFPVTGVEISKERKSFAVEMGIPVVSALSELRGKRFNYIHADQVFEHVSEPVALLRDLAPFLAEDGVLYISVPDCRLALADTRLGKVQLFRKSVRPLEHINCFTHMSLINFAQKGGLRPLSRFEIAKAFLKQVSFSRNGNLLQVAIETVYRYSKSTNLYFVKDI